MTELQNKLLEMLTWLTDYLNKNNYIYYAAYGTVLGAVRHGGFIPWDDDIDIAMPRKDYERLISSFVSTEKYEIESLKNGNNDFLYTFSKFYDSSTTLVERQHKNVKRGVYIDIFPLDGVKYSDSNDISKNSKKIYKLNNFLVARICAIRKERKFWKNCAIILLRLIPNFICDNKKLANTIDKLSSAIDYENSDYVVNYSCTYQRKDIMRKEIYGIPKTYKFEGIDLKCPEQADEYLTHLYGNWHQLPPLEKRGVQHDFLEINLNKSYKE